MDESIGTLTTLAASGCFARREALLPSPFGLLRATARVSVTMTDGGPGGVDAEVSVRRSPEPVWQLLLAVAILGLIAVWAVKMVFGFVEHRPQPAYLIPSHAAPIVWAAIAIMTLCVLIGLFSGQALAVALSTIGGILLIYGGILTIVGIPLMVLGGLAFCGAGILGRGSSFNKKALVIGSGIVLAIGLVFITMVGTHPPLVDCKVGGTTATYWFWGGSPSGPVSDTSSIFPDGKWVGEFSFSGRTYHYTCQDGKLLKFGQRR